jgi:integrase/recombinase XerD
MYSRAILPRMDVRAFTRHFSDCPKKSDRYWRRCRCPKWLYCAEWRPDRRSAKTRSWERAEEMARELSRGPQVPRITVGEAVGQFLTDKRNQNVSASWLRKFELLLTDWIPDREIQSLTLRDLEAFRDSWTGAAITKRKKQERLRSFFHYCVKHKWVTYNLAGDLSRIRVDQKPTEPLSREQFDDLLAGATGDFSALVLLMRYSGLRIGDAVGMKPERLKDCMVFLYTQKTGTPVRVPVPEWAEKQISPHLPLYREGRTFKSCVTDFQERFQKCGVHSHQLRDTFAVELLLAGVPIEEVSVLLGHSSIRVTERAYSPWVRARQERLEASVRKSWSTLNT